MNENQYPPPAGSCPIIPPHILRRLARSGDAVVAAAAREALRDVDEGLLRRHAHGRADAPTPVRSRLAPGTLDGGPVRLISDAGSTTQLPGVTVRGEGQAATGDQGADEAYDGLGATWTLYAEAFERNSLDGKGLPLRASVHYGKDYDNAFWDGTQMVFGDGDGTVFGRFTASLDVIGHELAHGVTEHTAGLMYQGQPGALNESMSDVFGSLVKQRELGQDAASADWLIGAELLIGEVAGQALRSMKEPGTAYDNPILGKDPQPGHMADYVDTDDDHGGVHINSGIPNKAFYLVATALGGNAWETPGHIWYAALTGPAIAADCDFVTFAGLTQDAAADLFGADSPEQAAVTAAWAGVGVLEPADPPVAPGDPASNPPGPPVEPGPADPPAGDPGGGVDPGGAGDPKGAGAPSGASVVEVSRSGGFAGRTLRREVALDDMPAPDASAWHRVLSTGTLQALDQAPTGQADRFCYGIACNIPRLAVTIPEQHLPEDLRRLFDRTLRAE